MTTLGLIGSGLIGSGIARLAVAAGYDVVLSNSRGPDTLADLVAELGPKARAATPAEAAEAGDLVIVSVPLKAYREVPVEPLRGKVVIDTNNYYPQRDGQIAELDDESTTVSELLQAHLPESRVAEFLDAIGYDAYDVGPLAEGWRYQRDTKAYAVFSQPGRPVKEDWLRKGLDGAVRYRDM
jgi:predicted dinucleotide-binding enzyme